MPRLNELNDSYELDNLVDNLKEMLLVEYETAPIYSDWWTLPGLVCGIYFVLYPLIRTMSAPKAAEAHLPLISLAWLLEK